MNSKTIILIAALGFLAIAEADPIFRNQDPLKSVRKPSGTCPSKDGQLPVYLPDSENCAIFYECSAGEAVPKECMPGLCFDSKLNVCAFPPSDKRAQKFRYHPFQPNDDGAGFRRSSDYIKLGLQKEPELPAAGQRELNNLVDTTTPGVLTTNDYEKASTNDEPLDPDYSEEDESHCLKVPPKPIGRCPKPKSHQRKSKLYFLPHEDDCSYFYQCSHGRPVQMCCPDDTCFDTELEVCV